MMIKEARLMIDIGIKSWYVQASRTNRLPRRPMTHWLCEYKIEVGWRSSNVRIECKWPAELPWGKEARNDSQDAPGLLRYLLSSLQIISNIACFVRPATTPKTGLRVQWQIRLPDWRPIWCSLALSTRSRWVLETCSWRLQLVPSTRKYLIILIEKKGPKLVIYIID